MHNPTGHAMSALDLFRLDGKVALVTGASRGLGRAMGLALAEAGADVAAVGRDPTTLGRFAEDVRSLGRDCLALAADLGERGAALRVVAEASAWKGHVDVLLNNAGTVARASVLEVTDDEWDQVVGLNLNAAFRVAQATARGMAAQGSGKIINIGSVNSVLGAKNVVPYAASKGGILQVTRAMANELGASGVQVNCILPGYFDTDLTQALRDDAERYEQILARTPAGRWGRPDDLAGAVVFLASGASDYVTGTALAVDGGFMISA